jgi:hypothetical protein
MFRCERVEECAGEILEMAPDHAREVGWGEADESSINVGAYLELERAGLLKIFTARTRGWGLAGYAIFTLSPHGHYGCPVAVEDALYLVPAWRGRQGLLFMRWQEEQLEEAGAAAIVRSSTTRHRHGRLLGGLGYQPVATTYLRLVLRPPRQTSPDLAKPDHEPDT